MISTVIFDLDDTLYDEVDYCKSGFAAVAQFLANLTEAFSAERIFVALWTQFATGNRSRTFNAALDELGVTCTAQLISKLIELYRSHIPKITLPDDSRDVLTQLSGKYALALLTDGFLPAQKLKVQTLGIEKYFKCLIYTEEIGREFWKPSPAGFEKIVQNLKAKPQNMAYVADNQVKDFIAPNKLGMATIQLIRPARIHKESAAEPDAFPQHIIHNINKLPALLASFSPHSCGGSRL